MYVNFIVFNLFFSIDKSYHKLNIVVKNNLPKKSDNRIIHVRPHTSKTYYEFTDGTIIAKGTKSNANQLPDGTWMTDYSFWINNDYILGQLGI